MSDPQDHAESFDEEAIGSTDQLLSDETVVAFPSESAHGVPFADSDVTDESFAERDEQQEPEVWERADKAVEASTENARERDERA